MMTRYATDQTVARDAAREILDLLDVTSATESFQVELQIDIEAIVIKAIRRARSAEVIRDARG